MHYTGQVYRHPIEGYTPLLEVTIGCSHNKCSFCTMYRETPFCVSPLSHVEEDLKQLKALGYDELHIGLESAYDPAILQMNKGFTQEEAYECLARVKEAGMSWDAIIMTGVAGKGNGTIHIEQTAKLLNEFPPYMLSIMTTSVSTGTSLEKMRDEGSFVECTELEKIEEEIMLLKLIDFKDCYFFGGHNYNLIQINAPLTRKNEIIKALEDGIHKIPNHILHGVKERANI